MGPQFHETMRGKIFFEKQLPDLTRAINRLAEAKEKENKNKSDVQTDAGSLSVVKREAFDNALQCLMANGVETGEAENVLKDICYILLGDYCIDENS